MSKHILSDYEGGEIPLRDRLWPDEPEKKAAPNQYAEDIPLSYRLWPDTAWPPERLYDLPSSPGVRHEIDRLFAEFYEREKDHWD